MTVQAGAAARVERQLAAVEAAQRIAGEEPTPEDMAAVRRVLLGQSTTEEEIRAGLAELEERFGLSR